MRHGHEKASRPDGCVKYEGDFGNNTCNGDIKYMESDGSVYIGKVEMAIIIDMRRVRALMEVYIRVLQGWQETWSREVYSP